VIKDRPGDGNPARPRPLAQDRRGRNRASWRGKIRARHLLIASPQPSGNQRGGHFMTQRPRAAIGRHREECRAGPGTIVHRPAPARPLPGSAVLASQRRENGRDTGGPTARGDLTPTDVIGIGKRRLHRCPGVGVRPDPAAGLLPARRRSVVQNPQSVDHAKTAGSGHQHFDPGDYTRRLNQLPATGPSASARPEPMLTPEPSFVRSSGGHADDKADDHKPDQRVRMATGKAHRRGRMPDARGAVTDLRR
jgi:hypothetical protein